MPPSHSPSQHSGRCTSVNPGVPAKQNLPLIRSSLTLPSLRAVILPQDPTQTLTTPTTQPSDTGTLNLPSARWTDTRGHLSPPSHYHGPHGAFLTRGMMTCFLELNANLWVSRELLDPDCGLFRLWLSLVDQELFLWQFYAVRSSHRDQERPLCLGKVSYALSILEWIWSKLCATHFQCVERSTLHLMLTSKICERLPWLAGSWMSIC